MENVVKLNEAFHTFTEASKSLQTYYEKLQEKVRRLTRELESKNAQLHEAILEVRESKDYLQTVLQSIGEAMIVLDQDERVTMINKAAEKQLCVDVNDVNGSLFRDLNCAIEESGSGTRLTAGGVTSDVIISRSAVSDPEGSVRGYVILIKDITRLKELERYNERNQRLIAMGEMAATIVHEIRSPLCSIELFSNMLSKDLKGTSHSDMANGISTGIKSLNNILTNMLFFAKPQKPTLNVLELGSAIEESIAVLVPLIQIRGIDISKKLTNEKVRGDLELMKQVLMNIILNAVQSMPSGGMLEINMSDNGGYISVDVIDEGEGVDPINIEKIFDPFFSTKDKGTGLGLAIAHKIMQSHGGFIKAFKNETRGSTFSVYFPALKSAGEEADRETLYEMTGNQT